jgi:hypothetical protein
MGLLADIDVASLARKLDLAITPRIYESTVCGDHAGHTAGSRSQSWLHIDRQLSIYRSKLPACRGNTVTPLDVRL